MIYTRCLYDFFLHPTSYISPHFDTFWESTLLGTRPLFPCTASHVLGQLLRATQEVQSWRIQKSRSVGARRTRQMRDQEGYDQLCLPLYLLIYWFMRIIHDIHAHSCSFMIIYDHLWSFMSSDLSMMMYHDLSVGKSTSLSLALCWAWLSAAVPWGRQKTRPFAQRWICRKRPMPRLIPVFLSSIPTIAGGCGMLSPAMASSAAILYLTIWGVPYMVVP